MGKPVKKNREIVVLSLGGSLIVPKKIDTSYLKRLRKVLLKHTGKMRFVIVVGGGKLARDYMDAGEKITELEKDAKDWIGIHATRLNASLVKNVFGEKAHNHIIIDPEKKVNFKEDFLVGAGYAPGWSSDYDAVLLAEQFGVNTIVNLTNVDFVYDKDPGRYKGAKPKEDLRWKDFLDIVGSRFNPGGKAPFDPVAAKRAMKSKMKVLVVNGREIDNLDKLLYGEIFRGTIIQ